MKVAFVNANLSVAAMVALGAAIDKYGPQMKTHRRSAVITSGVSVGADRVDVKDKLVILADGTSQRCAWLTKETNVNAAEKSETTEIVVAMGLIESFDGKLPIVYEGKKPPTKIEF